MFEVYKPSGNAGALTWLLWGVGLVVVAALAFVYQLLLDLIQMIYVNALLTMGMGIAIGTIATFIVKTGHCRSVWMATLVAITLASTGLGAKYAWQYRSDRVERRQRLETTNAIANEDRAAAIADFEENYSFADHIHNRAGAGWNIGRGNNGAPVGGWLVYLVWSIEAGIIFYFAWTMTQAEMKNPYNEKMKRWADESEIVMLLPITSDEMVRKIQSAVSVDQLLEIPIPKTDQSAKMAKYIVHSIAGQEMEDAYLTVNTIEYSIDKKGEQKITETSLVRNAVLSSQQRAQLVENAELLNEAMAEYRASLEIEKLGQQQQESSSIDSDTEGKSDDLD
jgi:hypothetical protein